MSGNLVLEQPCFGLVCMYVFFFFFFSLMRVSFSDTAILHVYHYLEMPLMSGGLGANRCRGNV